MMRAVRSSSSVVRILPLVLASVILPSDQAAAGEIKGYREPDPKVIAKAESIVATLKPFPSKKKRKVLIYAISFGPHRHSIPTARKVLALLGEKTGAYEPVVSEDLAHFEPDKLKHFAAVIFANTTGDVFCRPADNAQFKALGADERQKQYEIAKRLVKNLDDYMRAGGGFMGIHAATDTLKKNPAYTNMIGGVFAGHPWGPKETVTIKVEDPEHALIKGVWEEREFKFNDEIYQFREPYDRKRLRVLLSLNLEKSDKPKKPLQRKDGDYPVAWTRSHGKGRVFYCSLGHSHLTYANPAILKFWLRGIQFITGDIEANTEPSE